MSLLINQATGVMSRKDLLKQYGLIKNPYTDRTAEKTTLDDLSAYMHSDLQGFQPSGAACNTLAFSHCANQHMPD